jgi:hypothetical protein
MVTIFKNIYSKEAYYITVDEALDRIATGKSLKLVEEIRSTIDKEKANKLKANLPSVCFSGKFTGERKDDSIITHSGFIVLDFDSVADIREKQTDIISNKNVYACWVSPSGNGLKALIKVANGKKHREHFQALQEVFPEIDRSGINPSRVCYESYDSCMYLNKEAEVFKTIKKIEKEFLRKEVDEDEYSVFKKLVTWLSNRNDAFVTGERNNFIFKLASACCRYGIHEMSAQNLVGNEFLVSSEFSKTEANRAIRSAYKASRDRYATASFDKEVLVDKITRKEIEVDETVFDEGIRPQDVIYGIDVKDKALALYDSGYELVKGLGIADVDDRFKSKKGELTVLTGIGNYGKSSFKKWFQVFRVLLYGEKFGSFCPEDNPPEEYYHDLVEILLGCDCTPSNPDRPNREIYEQAYDFVCKHFFYVYPKTAEPTPKYVKEIFLELIIKEGIDGCDIDPFNQMSNNYTGFAGRDKYLEWVLTDFARFAIMNNVYFWIICHPIKLSKQTDGNYPCPDVFDLADGSMWNNKSDNILVYHRPFAQSEPQNSTCEFHSKKVRRQKTVGKKGFSLFEMRFDTRRFWFNGVDPVGRYITKKDIFPQARVGVDDKGKMRDMWTPYKDIDDLFEGGNPF